MLNLQLELFDKDIENYFLTQALVSTDACDRAQGPYTHVRSVQSHKSIQTRKIFS